MVGGALAAGRPVAFAVVTRLISWSYPDVQRISAEELLRWEADAGGRPPLLLDARSEAEFAVSHLPDARRVDSEQPDLTTLGPPSEQAPVVVYCSVGYRSARLARRLHEAGYRHVLNLEGSIFRWANEDRPLVNASGATSLVHPYDGFLGRLVEPHHRAR